MQQAARAAAAGARGGRGARLGRARLQGAVHVARRHLALPPPPARARACALRGQGAPCGAEGGHDLLPALHGPPPAARRSRPTDHRPLRTPHPMHHPRCARRRAPVRRCKPWCAGARPSSRACSMRTRCAPSARGPRPHPNLKPTPTPTPTPTPKPKPKPEPSLNPSSNPSSPHPYPYAGAPLPPPKQVPLCPPLPRCSPSGRAAPPSSSSSR